jgi:hypothetical protein
MTSVNTVVSNSGLMAAPSLVSVIKQYLYNRMGYIKVSRESCVNHNAAKACARELVHHF